MGHSGGVPELKTDRGALAAFLRSRREALSPGDVGLPEGPRRRTPGLRREEVAALAGMSADYYVRIEQGRGPRPSRQMLSAIARALCLTDDERDHVFRLGGEAPVERGPSRDVPSGVLRLLDALEEIPALVCDATYEVLAWNPMAAALITDFSSLTGLERNVIWRFFTSRAARERHDPESAAAFARESVADLRGATARYPGDPRMQALVDGLLERSTEFRQLWELHEVAVRRSASKRLHHPLVGWLDLDCQPMHLPHVDQWLVCYTAAPNTPTYEALQLLRVIGTQTVGPDIPPVSLP
jgi:transcriptional regulator with XRE-family HTH domain